MIQDFKKLTSEKNVLHLTLKKKWFNMIGRGFKKEEYREIKPYWTKRLTESKHNTSSKSFKKFDVVIFRNGYAKNAPTLVIEFKEIKVDYGNPKWGASNEQYYCIDLGEILYNSTT